MSLQKKYKQEMIDRRNHIAKYGIPVEQRNPVLSEHIKQMSFDKLVKLLESPYNIGYNDRNEFETIYNPSFKKDWLCSLTVYDEEYITFFSKEAETFFMFHPNDMNTCLADLQICSTSEEKTSQIVFSWQDHNKRGLIRELLKYLVMSGTINKVVSGYVQSENAFEMWKKLADDTVVCVGIYGNNEQDCLKPQDLLQSFGGLDKREFLFALTKK